ncbi:---NA---, partial [Paramuricea clavata]
QISLPPGGDTFVVLPGENVTIAWKLDVSISDLSLRSWTFLPKGDNSFAEIFRDRDVDKKPQYSPGPFTIKNNATLILKNVNIQYNGTYRFSIVAKGKLTKSDVTVFIA